MSQQSKHFFFTTKPPAIARKLATILLSLHLETPLHLETHLAPSAAINWKWRIKNIFIRARKGEIEREREKLPFFLSLLLSYFHKTLSAFVLSFSSWLRALTLSIQDPYISCHCHHHQLPCYDQHLHHHLIQTHHLSQKNRSLVLNSWKCLKCVCATEGTEYLWILVPCTPFPNFHLFTYEPADSAWREDFIDVFGCHHATKP